MNKNLVHHWEVASRRQFFQRAGSGLAGIALANMLQQDGLMAAKLADAFEQSPLGRFTSRLVGRRVHAAQPDD